MLQKEQDKVVCTYEDEENLKAFIKQKNIPDEYFDKLHKILYRVYGTIFMTAFRTFYFYNRITPCTHLHVNHPISIKPFA